jgi:glycosyltransferase involved in cell wall biosynthesis
VDVFLVNGRANTWNYLWGVLRLWAHLIRHPRYDVIHAHYALAGVVARLQILYPVVITFHGVEILNPVRWLRDISRLVYLMCDRVIVVSQREKDALNDAQVIVIPCGVDFGDFNPIPQAEARAKLELPPDKPLVLWAGEYWRAQKQFHLVEASMELVKQRRPEAELIVVSKQPHEVVPLYMSACDVLVLTSAYEGSPMVIKEAMACNLPIVSTDVGDVADVIEGVDGCCLAEPQADDIAAKLLATLADCRRTQGRERIIAHLNSRRIAERVIAVYNELCRPNRRLEIPIGESV